MQEKGRGEIESGGYRYYIIVLNSHTGTIQAPATQGGEVQAGAGPLHPCYYLRGGPLRPEPEQASEDDECSI